MSNRIENRFNRIKGQLTSLQERICAEAPCEDVIPQFLAVKGAFNAAFDEYLKSAIASCGRKDSEKLAQLISLIARS